jgi:hypothetical protein
LFPQKEYDLPVSLYTVPSYLWVLFCCRKRKKKSGVRTRIVQPSEDSVDNAESQPHMEPKLLTETITLEDDEDKTLEDGEDKIPDDLHRRLKRKPLKREDKVLSEDVNSRLMRKTRKVQDQSGERVHEDIKSRRTRTPRNREEADLKCRVMIKSLKKEEQLQAGAGLVEDINSRLMKKKVGTFENQGT